MRALLRTFFVTTILLGFTSCESELPNRDPSLSNRLKDGLRGQGTLYIPQNEVASPFSTGTSGQ